MKSFWGSRFLGREGKGWLGDAGRAWRVGVPWTLGLLVAVGLGVCPCTAFEAGALGLIVAAVLTGGSSLYGAITEEREKKTWDSLRLTQLRPLQIVAVKLLGEAAAMGRLLLAGGAPLALLTLLGGAEPGQLLGVLGLAAVAGLLAMLSGVWVSAVARTTSQAVLWGWVLKGFWLVGTPILDLVLQAVTVGQGPRWLAVLVNPLAILGAITVPEAIQVAPWSLGLTASGLALALAAGALASLHRRLGSDLREAGGPEDPRVHPLWRGRGGLAGALAGAPGLARNPVFLRELAAQVRSGGGGWAGYAVFLVLFLAPLLYARAWADRDPHPARVQALAATLQVSQQAPADLDPDALPASPSPRPVSYLRLPGELTTLVLEGHAASTCWRVALYQGLGIPLPERAVSVIAVPRESAEAGPGGPLARRRAAQVEPEVLARFGLVRPGRQPERPASRGHGAPAVEPGGQPATGLGFQGTLILFFLYLSVRSASFLAGSLTGERDRRGWQALALTGIPASSLLWGKAAGSLFFPVLQMTAVFPVLSVYVWLGRMTLPELAVLYVYSVALAAVSGTVGLWASAGAASTHRAQAVALSRILGLFLLSPLSPLLALFGPLWALLRAARASRVGGPWDAWLTLAIGLCLAPLSLFPAAAVLFGQLPPRGEVWGGPAFGLGSALLGSLLVLGSIGRLCWLAALARVQDPDRSGGLASEP